MRPLGSHLILELRDANPVKLNDVALLRRLFKQMIQSMNLSLLKLHIHQFEPQGLTGFALISESHISVHTWPENGTAAIDIFTCGNKNPEIAAAIFVDAFEGVPDLLTIKRPCTIQKKDAPLLLQNQLWFSDTVTDKCYIAHAYHPIVNHRSPFQRIEIVTLSDWGKALILNGIIQSTEYDEFIYHENLVHIAMLGHPNPEQVLVLGGGGGATIREVFKYPGVKKCVMIEIDKDVVQLCQQYLPQMSQGNFEDERLQLIIQDATAYLKESSDTFDVIISDVIDSMDAMISDALFSSSFFKRAKQRLKENGVLVVQACDLFLQTLPKVSAQIKANLKKEFMYVETHTCYVPSFGGEWSFHVASDAIIPRDWSREVLQNKLKTKLNTPLRYLDADGFLRSISLPGYVKQILCP